MITNYELRYNISAMVIAILKGINNPDKAFSEVAGKKYKPTKEDFIDMYKLKKSGVSCEEIADIYGIHWRTVYRKLELVREKGDKIEVLD